MTLDEKKRLIEMVDKARGKLIKHYAIKEDHTFISYYIQPLADLFAIDLIEQIRAIPIDPPEMIMIDVKPLFNGEFDEIVDKVIIPKL